MKCYQCTNPAMYLVTAKNIPLCLDCYFKFSQIEQQQIENNERMLNYLSDEMAEVAGMPPTEPRFPPRPRPVVVAGTKLQNIRVENSVVGTVNTGSIGSVDQSISGLIYAGDKEVAEAIKALSEAVLKSNDLSRNQQNEIIESLSVLAREAASPPEARQRTVAESLLHKARAVAATAKDISEVCEKWWPVLAAALGIVLGG